MLNVYSMPLLVVIGGSIDAMSNTFLYHICGGCHCQIRFHSQIIRSLSTVQDPPTEVSFVPKTFLLHKAWDLLGKHYMVIVLSTEYKQSPTTECVIYCTCACKPVLCLVPFCF